MSAKFLTHNLNRLYLAQCLLFLAALGVVFSLASPYFLSAGNIGNILTASAVIGLLAIGTTFVIASGGIDLSSAAVMAFSGTVCAWCMQKGAWPPALAILFSIGLGGFCGFLSGLLINITRAPSFIVTLGMLSIARAAAYIVSDGMPIYGLNDNVINLGQSQLFGVPVPVILLVAGALIASLFLTRTKFGAHTLLLGDNAFAATAMGVPVERLRLKIFTLAGLYSGVAGIIFMLRTNSGDPTAGQNYELIAITAAILGGANLFGGRATIIGTVLGFLCLGVLQNGLNLLAVSTYYQILFVGLVLLAAAFLSRVGYRR
jgi:ribose/xylose/arabinose/galactoside ABC-type transport system permease subunit